MNEEPLYGKWEDRLMRTLFGFAVIAIIVGVLVLAVSVLAKFGWWSLALPLGIIILVPVAHFIGKKVLK